MGKVIRMVDYVKGSQNDNWHWCKNCTQYPMYIYQTTPFEPFYHLCEQCKARVESAICQIEELEETTPKRQLRSAFH